MIKINLIKIGKGGAPLSPVTVSEKPSLSEESMIDNQTQNEALKRFFLILIGPIALYIYFERIQNPELLQQGAAMKIEIDKLDKEVKKTASTLAAVKDFEKQTQILKQKIDVIENLKKGRMLLVKVLDTVQNKIPQKIWLTKIEVNNGVLVMSGLTKNSNDVVTFEEQLRKSVFFKDVTTQKVLDSKTGDASASSFQIRAIIEENLENFGGTSENR